MTLDQLIAIIFDTKTGIAGVLAVMWWLERQRANRLDLEKTSLIREVLDGLHTSTIAVTSVSASVDDIKDIVNVALIRRDPPK